MNRFSWIEITSANSIIADVGRIRERSKWKSTYLEYQHPIANDNQGGTEKIDLKTVEQDKWRKSKLFSLPSAILLFCRRLMNVQ